MKQALPNSMWLYVVWHAFVGVLVCIALASVAAAPMEETMGDAQRVLYIHVGVAWIGLVGFILMAVTAALYLMSRNLVWDGWSQAAGELGWLCSSLTLITGSLWAHAAWGVWWTWEPRLLTSFILWALFSGYLLIRGSIDDPHHRGRLSAVVAILGVLDVPLVMLATRWFRGMHPVAPEMEPSMRIALLLVTVCLTAVFGTLLVHRRLQIELEHRFSEIHFYDLRLALRHKPIV